MCSTTFFGSSKVGLDLIPKELKKSRLQTSDFYSFGSSKVAFNLIPTNLKQFSISFGSSKLGFDLIPKNVKTVLIFLFGSSKTGFDLIANELKIQTPSLKSGI